MELNDYNENYGSGWIMLYRSIKKHWIFQDSKFFKWWVVMLMEANHSERKITLGYSVYNIKKGESANSLRTWANLFESNTKSVSKFFKLLQKDDMISIQTIGKGKQSTTLININNYANYQGQSETQETTQETTQGKRERDTNNNYNNYNNTLSHQPIEKKETNIYPEKLLIENWAKCREHYLKQPTGIKNLNFQERNALKEALKNYTKEEINEAMITLFQQEKVLNESMRLRPQHFLDKIDVYYSGNGNTKIWGK